jgi:hypothetical protein
MTGSLNEFIGWFGAGAFVLAYMLLSLKVLTSDKVLYHYMNALGGLLMSVSTFNMHDRPAFFVNFIWMGIAIFSIVRIYLLKARKAQ